MIYFFSALGIHALSGNDIHGYYTKADKDRHKVIETTDRTTGTQLNESVKKSEAENRESDDQTFSHIHNQLVYIPILLTLIAFLLTLAGIRNNKFEAYIKYIVLVAAIFSMSALISGLNQADHIAGTKGAGLINSHKTLGISSMIILWIWFLFIIYKPLRKRRLFISIISVLLLVSAAFLGGILAQ